MTTIVALHTPGRGTIIASDTQVTMGSGLVNYMPKGKIVTRNGWAIGICGAYKTQVLLERHANDLLKDIDGVHDIGDRIAILTKEYGYTTCSVDGGGAPLHDNNLVLANADGVWDLDSAYAEMPAEPGMLIASGSGRDFALGSGYTSVGMRDPMKRVRLALESAMRYDNATGGDIIVTELRCRKSR